MAHLALLLRGLWWRRGLTGALLAVAVVTTTAAALGPLYARAAAESTLNDHLTGATWHAGIHATTQVDISTAGTYGWLRGHVLRPGRVRGYDRTIHGLTAGGEIGVSFPGGMTGNVQSQVVWRQGACRHLVIVRGHCPNGPGQALASERSLGPGFDWHLGRRLVAYFPAVAVRNVGLRIVGSYRPQDTQDPFWFGHNYFNAVQLAGQPPIVDSLFVARNTFTSLPEPTFVEADFDYPLTANHLRLSHLPAERRAVRGLIADHMGGLEVIVRSGLFGVLDAAAHEKHLVDVGTLLVILQLGLLAWLVLFQVVADAIEARANEIAMAKLRGHSPLTTIRFGLGEPLVLLLAAIPLGLLAAWGVTHAFAGTVLVPGVPVVVTAAPVWAALAAFAGGLVAAVLAGHRVLTRSVLDQWRRTTRRPTHGRLALAADVVLAGAAVAGLVVLRAGHTAGSGDDSVALLAPGLLVFAVAVLGVRLLPLACRGLARSTRATRRIATFLASRQVARRPVGLRLAALLAVAAGLATFAVAGETVATTNRDARAAAELGADRVASVQFGAALDPVIATREADPGGTWAMAAATWLPDDGALVAEPVLGVDSTRLAAVGKPVSGGMSAAQLGAAITGRPIRELDVSASRMRVHLTARGLTGSTRPHLQLNFRTLDSPFLNVDAGAIHDGSGNYAVAVPCVRGCLLRGLTWDRPFGAVHPIRGSITLTGVDVATGGDWRPLHIAFGDAAFWRAAVPQGQAHDHLTALRHGVRDEFGNRNGGYGGIVYGSAPTPLPAVAARATLFNGSDPPGALRLVDAIGTVARFSVTHRVGVLPAVLDVGVAMDAQYLESELPEFRNEASWQVWLSKAAPADALHRLAAVGLQVQSVHTEAQRIAVLGRQGPALALLLLVVCAIAGAVLAAGGTAISVSASSRRRSFEIAALRAVGVRRPALMRAGVLEQLLLLGAAVVLGVPTGLLAARLAMPVIPEFSDTTPVVLRYVPQWLPTLGFVAAFVVLLTLTAVLGARAPMRRAVPSRLREVEG